MRYGSANAGGEINIPKYWQQNEGFLRPPAPNSGGAWTQSPPGLGALGGFGVASRHYEIFRQQRPALPNAPYKLQAGLAFKIEVSNE